MSYENCIDTVFVGVWVGGEYAAWSGRTEPIDGDGKAGCEAEDVRECTGNTGCSYGDLPLFVDPLAMLVVMQRT